MRLGWIVRLAVSLAVLGLASSTILEDHLDAYHVVFASRITKSHSFHGNSLPEGVLTHDSESWLLSAMGKKFHLQLERNLNLLPKNYQAWEWKDGQLYPSGGYSNTYNDNRYHCHYTGSVKGYAKEESYAAISMCSGELHGEIRTPELTFFIEPHSFHFDASDTSAVREECLNSKLSSDHCALHHKHLDSHFGTLDNSIRRSGITPHVLYTRGQLKPVEYRCPVEGDHVALTEEQISELRVNRNHDHSHDESPLLGSKASQSTVGEVQKKFSGLHAPDPKYVELLIVNDYTRYSSKSSLSACETNSATLVNIAHTRYLFNNLSPPVLVILTAQITMTSSDAWGTPATCTTPMYAGAIDHSDLLTKFETWAWSSAASALISNGGNFDNAHLFSGYHFCSATVGYAPVGSMCLDTYSTGISQPLYADQQSADIITHEMGHNFNMLHDSSSNTCASSGYIMAAVGNLESSNYVTDFSNCSRTYYTEMMTYRGTSTACLDNIPEIRWQTSFCGDGWIDSSKNEQCDCGSSDCSSVDPCCNGATCKLITGAECSALDACCSSCKIVSASVKQVCRAAAHGTCDVEEMCDGESSSCPADIYSASGTSCSDSSSNSGLCYHGDCVNAYQQCKGIYDTNTGPCYTPSNPCAQNLLCTSSSTSQCTAYQVTYGDGTPCSKSGVSNGQCYNTTCVSASNLQYVWATYCNLSCGGSLVQQIRCRKYDGTWWADSYCSSVGTKPTVTGSCSSFAPQLCSVGVSTSTGSSVGTSDTVNITWSTVRTVDFVSLAVFSSLYTWPVYASAATNDTQYYVYTIPSVYPPGSHHARVYVSSSVYMDTSNFTVKDLCSSVSCVNGVCAQGKCVCSAGYTGTLCDQDLCTAAGIPCNTAGGNCSTTSATCICAQGNTGRQCQQLQNLTCSACSSKYAEYGPSNCTCDCVGGYTGSSCDTCSLNCGSYGKADDYCEKCVCNSWGTGSSCQYIYAYITVYLGSALNGQDKILQSSASVNDSEKLRFSSLLQAEISFLTGVNSSKIVVQSDNITTDAGGNIGVRFQLIGADTSKSNLESVITTLSNALKAQYGAATRLYVLRNVNSSVDLKVEGDNLFATAGPKSVTDQINAIVAWIKSNLVIVVPVAVVVGLLLVYKLWYDSRHSGDKQVIAGLDEDDYGHRAAVRPKKEKSGRVRENDGDKKKKKKKRQVEKKRKDKEFRQGEAELENEFGVRVVRKGGYSEPAPAYEEDDGDDDRLPPNWSIQHFDDGTKFYFNSVTNDISQERPKFK